ncbi:F-box/LRR-repeat protein, partial [Trifolium medium]|nr:F-box/LRR-repeat protein [Trifolium medium]
KCPLLSEIKMECIGRNVLYSVEKSDSLKDFGVYPHSWICTLARCCKIRHLNLSRLQSLRMKSMNFKVLTLEVLNVSKTGIDDRSLYMISKSCLGLLQLDLALCYDVTEKGVMQVAENCTQLREINMRGCRKVAADVDLMVFIRPSLKKIMAPPHFYCSQRKTKLFLRNGCFVKRSW